MNPKVDEYIDKAPKWQDEMMLLRALLLECGLTEELKWRVPCYTYRNNNIIIIGAFKETCTLSFFKGVLLNDVNGILVAPGENSQSVKMAVFTDIQEIKAQLPILKAYVFEAIEVEKAGLKVDKKGSEELVFSEELNSKLNTSPAFKKAFESLTPGRQRAYNLYFSAPKQAKTRITRIEKYTQQILNGKGINDCVCGMSKKMPNCDGSHKYI